MLHSIATGNLLPAWVKVACVDINPATVTKLTDRGSIQTVGVVTDAEPFLRALVARTGEAAEPRKRSETAMRQPRILMCPPDYYGIEYEINPWMSRAARQLAGTGRRAVAQALRDPGRPGRDGRTDDAAAGLARPGVHGQRRA